MKAAVLHEFKKPLVIEDVGTSDDLREVLAMAAAGKVRWQVTSRPLAQVNEVLDELRHGRIAGRVVLTPRG